MAYSVDYRTIPEIRQELDDSFAFLNAVLDQVGDRWETQVYSEGAAWNARQLLIHIAITDTAHNNMVMGYANGIEVVPPDFDVERYNRRSVEKRAEMSPDEARASLKESRAALLAWLDGVTDEDVYEKTGRHGTLNIFSIRQILRVLAQHEKFHAVDIAQALGITVGA